MMPTMIISELIQIDSASAVPSYPHCFRFLEWIGFGIFVVRYVHDTDPKNNRTSCLRLAVLSMSAARRLVAYFFELV